MPDENGKLTQDELKELLEWSEKKFPNGIRCPLCQTNPWHPDVLMTAHPLATGKERFHKGREDSVSLTCEGCGDVALYRREGGGYPLTSD